MLRSAWSPPLPHAHTFSSSTVKPCPSGQLADTSINTSSARENLTLLCCTFLMFPTQLHFLHKDTEGTVRASALCPATQKLLYTHGVHVCISSQKSFIWNDSFVLHPLLKHQTQDRVIISIMIVLLCLVL